MKIPVLKFREDFLNGYDDLFVKQLICLQKDRFKDDFLCYPDDVQKKIADEEAELKKFYTAVTGQNVIMEHAYDLVKAELNKNGIKDVVPLKGVYLLKTIFNPYPGLRRMCDVDILVRKEDYERSKEILDKKFDVGVRDEKRPLYSRIFSDYPVMVRDTLVEVHRGRGVWDLFKINYNDFFEAGEGNLPSPEYMTAFYLLHDLSDGLNSFQPLNYRKIVTLYLLLANLELSKLEELLRKYRMIELLDIYLFLLHEVFKDVRFEKRENFITGRIVKGKGNNLFEFSHGETMFKLLVFRKTIFRKVLPKVITSLLGG